MRVEPVANGTAESSDQIRELLEGVTPEVIPQHVYDQMLVAWHSKPTALVRLRHTVKVMRHVGVDITPDMFEQLVDVYLVDLPMPAQPVRPQPRPEDGLIYYLRVGALIKVGFTTNLRQRLAAYPPDSKLLATEVGGTEAEKLRHAQFVHDLSHGNEWFRPSVELIEHINSLRHQPLSAADLAA